MSTTDNPVSPRRHNSNLEEYERSSDGRPVFFLTYSELKLLGIAGVSRLSLLELVLAMLNVNAWVDWFLP